MKTYIVESIKYPTELIFAWSERLALDEYAQAHGFKDGNELRDDCERECGITIDLRDCIDIECISEVCQS